jgi:hypothetical protein
MEARMANARLMEDNESYQLLLQEKTLHGDFGKGDFSYMGVSANQDALNALEGRPAPARATSLADELGDAAEGDGEDFRRMETELRSMKDQNKALTLYINRIIERLLQHQDFEHILDQSSDFKPPNTNKDLPPPPPEKATGPSLLQRAKTMAVGTPKPKPRPMSFMPSAQSAHTDPVTAPSIPIGNLTRSSSTRRSRPMSEQYLGGSSLVNQIYKGPPDGPVSPPLGNPRNSQTFFMASSSGLSGNPNAGARAPSGTQAASTGNFPGMRSETSSTSGDSGDLGTPPSQSPPRAHNHEKTTTFAGGKPRLLRLVQENPDAVKAEANKRASWIGMGWPSWAKKEEPSTAGSSEAIPE